MRYYNYIGFALAAVLTALGIIFRNSSVFAVILFTVALGIFGGIVIADLRKKLPVVLLKRNQTESLVKKVYNEASKKGGRLFVTHVRPCRTAPSEDFAVQQLQRVESHLEYERFLFLEDRNQEIKWVRNTLTKMDSDVVTNVYTCRSIPFIPSPLWRILPRANLMLYNHDNKYTSIVGLDRLVTSDSRLAHANFAVVIRTKEAFDTLQSYFHAMTANKRWIDCDKNLGEYENSHSIDIVMAPTQSAIAALLSLCENKYRNDVLHSGLFGRRALEYAGFVAPGHDDNQEADIDLMLIVRLGSKEIIRRAVDQKFDSHDELAIVWGDDEDYFYFYREPGKRTLDIELLEAGTEFYQDHPLLGHSIFAFYMTLYRKEAASAVHELVKLPKPYPSYEERIRVLLKDRKGLNEFSTRLKGESALIDPRRIISQLIRNLAWVTTGVRHHDVALAFETIRNDPRMSEFMCQCECAVEVSKRSLDESKRLQGDGIAQCRKLVDGAIHWAKRYCE